MWHARSQVYCIAFLAWSLVTNCTSTITPNESQLKPGNNVLINPLGPILWGQQNSRQSSSSVVAAVAAASQIPRGGGGLPVPAGWNPFGYAITDLGTKFLSFEGALDSDVGRFLASLKSGRKTQQVLKDQWLEIVRVSKKGQSMRIYRTLDDLIDFCLKAGFID